MNYDNTSMERLGIIRQQCAAYREESPHPSRPHIETAVDNETWNRIHSHFQELLSAASDTNNDSGREGTVPQIPLQMAALTDLCVFVRNAAAMDRGNQDKSSSAGIVDDIIYTIKLAAQHDIAYSEAANCAALAGQALSNMVTGNKKLQHMLVEKELTSNSSLPSETAYWYLLASTSNKAVISGLVLILNNLKGYAGLTKMFCSSQAGKALVAVIGERFGESEDDEAEEKTLLYAILSGIIECKCLELVLTDELVPKVCGLLDALAVYCNSNSDPAIYNRVSTNDLLQTINAILASCSTALLRIFRSSNEAETIASDDIMDMQSIMVVHHALGSTISIIGSITTDMLPALVARISESNLVQQTIALLGLLSRQLPRIEKASMRINDSQTSSVADSVAHLFMLKRDLIQILGNVAYKNPVIQDRIREQDGLALVLDHMRIDENHPYIKEYAVVALKHLLEGNNASQEYVRHMGAIDTVQDPRMASAGLYTRLGEDGRLVIARDQHQHQQQQ
ncbi:Ataxin-10 [Coemansia sp. RSA 988]|nr:Ataxin-10 [Coemansia sp. RSA 988]